MVHAGLTVCVLDGVTDRVRFRSVRTRSLVFQVHFDGFNFLDGSSSSKRTARMLFCYKTHARVCAVLHGY